MILTEKVLEICNELNISRDHIKIEYDKTRHAHITITVPMHCFDIYESDIESWNDFISACDATMIYEVYRNNECVFIGNDMYDKMFLILLKTLLSQV